MYSDIPITYSQHVVGPIWLQMCLVKAHSANHCYAPIAKAITKKFLGQGLSGSKRYKSPWIETLASVVIHK